MVTTDTSSNTTFAASACACEAGGSELLRRRDRPAVALVHEAPPGAVPTRPGADGAPGTRMHPPAGAGPHRRGSVLRRCAMVGKDARLPAPLPSGYCCDVGGHR